MSSVSDQKGTQACIKRASPRAAYVHCNSHKLNLVISHSCSLPQICMVIDKLSAMFLFFNWPKRAALLQKITTQEHPKGSKRKPLIDLCTTRWAARHDA
jgi:hypothetical protein